MLPEHANLPCPALALPGGAPGAAAHALGEPHEEEGGMLPPMDDLHMMGEWALLHASQ